MTAPSPVLAAGALASFAIKSSGKPIDSTFQVVSIDIWTAVGRVPKARIVLFDGSASERDFDISELETFVPGKKIEIAAGYEGTNRTVFNGVIVKQGLEINENEGPKLVVDVTDACDWDLMLTRAEMNGFVVMVEDGKVTVKEPDTSQLPVLRVRYGESILDLRTEMSAATQFASSAITSVAWDMATQKLVNSGPGPVNVTEPGNISSATLAKVFGVSKLIQQTGATIEPDALKMWSSAELLKSKLSKICGQVRFQGSSLAKVGKTIELAGLGDRFDGTVFISGVHHRISGGRWLTTAGFGLSAHWFAAETHEIAAPAAAGQLPPIQGLQTGIVKKVAGDPGAEFRVFVTLPMLGAAASGVWARLATYYASNKVGAVFYPEVNDEVIVGFMNQDPRDPVILGSVYSKKLPPPVAPDEKNNTKSLVTRSKLEIRFDEEKKIITIRTPGKHSITLDDKGAAITLEDSNGNSVVVSARNTIRQSWLPYCGTMMRSPSEADSRIQRLSWISLSSRTMATVCVACTKVGGKLHPVPRNDLSTRAMAQPPIRTVGKPMMMVPPCAVLSPIRAAGSP